MKQVHHFNWKINIDVSFSVKYEFSSYNLSWYIEVKSFKVFFFLNLLIYTSTSTYNTRLTSELIEWDGVVFLKTSCGKGENNVSCSEACITEMFWRRTELRLLFSFCFCWSQLRDETCTMITLLRFNTII